MCRGIPCLRLLSYASESIYRIRVQVAWLALCSTSTAICGQISAGNSWVLWGYVQTKHRCPKFSYVADNYCHDSSANTSSIWQFFHPSWWLSEILNILSSSVWELRAHFFLMIDWYVRLKAMEWLCTSFDCESLFYFAHSITVVAESLGNSVFTRQVHVTSVVAMLKELAHTFRTMPLMTHNIRQIFVYERTSDEASKVEMRDSDGLCYGQVCPVTPSTQNPRNQETNFLFRKFNPASPQPPSKQWR